MERMSKLMQGRNNIDFVVEYQVEKEGERSKEKQVTVRLWGKFTVGLNGGIPNLISKGKG